MQILGYGTFSLYKDLHKCRTFCKKGMQKCNVLQYNKEQVFPWCVHVFSTRLKLCMRVFRNSFETKGQYYIFNQNLRDHFFTRPSFFCWEGRFSANKMMRNKELTCDGLCEVFRVARIVVLLSIHIWIKNKLFNFPIRGSSQDHFINLFSLS